ncbi:hypothetical protein [Mucisphaera sp.]|uniref:hypothetical protein n=1 Tax=Mucisphaera sp. TaxID=2913024 RepID=UPI003D13D04B
MPRPLEIDAVNGYQPVIEWHEPWGKDFARLGPYTNPTKTLATLIPLSLLAGCMLFALQTNLHLSNPSRIYPASGYMGWVLILFNTALAVWAITGVGFLATYGKQRFIRITRDTLAIASGKMPTEGFIWAISNASFLVKRYPLDELSSAHMDSNDDGEHSLVIKHRDTRIRLVIDRDQTAQEIKKWLNQLHLPQASEPIQPNTPRPISHLPARSQTEMALRALP